MSQNTTTIQITTGTLVRFVAIILFLFFLYLLKDVVIIFLFALIVASAITPFADWLDSKGFPRLLGVLILYLAIFSLGAFVISMIVPVVTEDVAQLTQALPSFVAKISNSLEDVQQGSPRYLDFISELQNILEGTSTFLQQASQSIFSLVTSIFGGIFAFLAVLVISFYLAVMKRGIESFLAAVVPSEHEDYILNLWARAQVKVGLWIQGQLLLAFTVVLIVYVGLSLMGVKYALLLGGIAMILELVPVVGPTLAAIPAIILAFFDSPSLGLWTLVFYLLVQQVENHVLVPLVLGKTIGLNPVVVIIALLVGAQIAGIPGMFLAVPIATVLVEVFEDMAKEKTSRRQNT